MARPSFAAALDEAAADLAALADDVREALRLSIAALLERDPRRADDAVDIELQIVEASSDLDRRCALLLATQAPVADDLRLIIAIIRLAAELDRSAHLAGHIARQVARVDPTSLPADIQDRIRVLSGHVDDVYGLAVTAFRTRDPDLAAVIDRTDDEVDRLSGELVTTIIEAGRAGSLDAGDIVNLALLTRYLERLADHAVTLSRRTLWFTGEMDSEDDGGDGPPSPPRLPGDT